MEPHERRALGAAQRTHLPIFLMKAFETLHPGKPPLACGWYIRAMCHALEEVEQPKGARLVITVPPRHLKSITASVAYVAWALGRDPTIQIMVASYSSDLSRLHASDCRKLMETAWYKRLFPHTRIAQGANRALEFETTRGGGRKAVSVGGSVTGFGCDLIIVDDCMKADDVRSPARRTEVHDWFRGTLLSRLDDKAAGNLISIQQRLHEDDLPAMLLEQGYKHLNLPAIAEKDETIPIGMGRVHVRGVGDLLNPEREDQATLDRLRHALGASVFSAQYQQNPIAPEGNLLRLEWFQTYDEAPPRSEFRKVVQSWDTAMSASPTSDYSVCTTWGFTGEEWLLLDVFRKRLDFPDLEQAVRRLQKQWRADLVLVEDAAVGKPLVQRLRAENHRYVRLWQAATSKEERFAGCFADIKDGVILLPKSAPWLEDYRRELRAFPNGRHDDQVDSTSQFIRFQIIRWPWVVEERNRDGRVCSPAYRSRPYGKKRAVHRSEPPRAP